jgi:hypothetical protein
VWSKEPLHLVLPLFCNFMYTVKMNYLPLDVHWAQWIRTSDCPSLFLVWSPLHTLQTAPSHSLSFFSSFTLTEFICSLSQSLSPDSWLLCSWLFSGSASPVVEHVSSVSWVSSLDVLLFNKERWVRLKDNKH